MPVEESRPVHTGEESGTATGTATGAGPETVAGTAGGRRAPGLTAAQVAERVRDGLTNDAPQRGSRSTADIVRANVFNRINALLGVLLVIVLAAGSPIDGMFGLVIIANSGIGIIQELRAKRTLDKLTIVGQARPVVRRDGAAAELPPQRIVQDDVVEIGSGDQLVVDGEVIEAAGLDVDESLLTGESDAVHKPVGARVLSGSFVSAGSGAFRATDVGARAYAAKLADEASRFSMVDSELRSGVDRILKFVTFLLIPAGVLTIVNQLTSTADGVRDSLIGMVAALVPMVPEGLVLMTSIAFAVGVIRLGQRQCLVQELPAIEGLARVDVVCADKTGTLTENGMRMAEARIPAGGNRGAGGEARALDEGDGADGGGEGEEATVRSVLAALAAAEARPNASVQAIKDALPDDPGWRSTAVAPFSSANKWSGISFDGHGNWLLGAPDVLLSPESQAAREAEELGARGLRVLLLAEGARPVDAPGATAGARPAALVVLEQKVRPDARATLDYFGHQGVAVKVISGDNAVSVGAVADSLGIDGGARAIDARTLPEDRDALADVLAGASTFGRVRPDQKRAMVGALQSRGHTVAMTGDGVNDVLALKDADIGVAMGSGSPATRSVAQIVLLDDAFATLPYVVGEGRRVIGNIERVANLFLTKTVYSALLAFMVAISGLAFTAVDGETLAFPFLPRHVTIAAWFTIGVPSFILSLAPNNERARTGFVRRVLRLAVPSGTIIAVVTFACYLMIYQGADVAEDVRVQVSTSVLITLIAASLWVLVVVARPYRWWKIALLACSALAYVVLFSIPFARTFFEIDPSHWQWTVLGLAWGIAGAAAVEAVFWINRIRTGDRRPLWGAIT